MPKHLPLLVLASIGLAAPAAAQETGSTVGETVAQSGSPRLAFEAGLVMSVIAQPYLTAGVVSHGWSVRVSGKTHSQWGGGLQLNAGRVIRDEGNAKHTLGVMWATYDGDRYFWPGHGHYAGIAYDFQVKSFFLETGWGLGARNPFMAQAAPFGHVYGQVGYVQRF